MVPESGTITRVKVPDSGPPLAFALAESDLHGPGIRDYNACYGPGFRDHKEQRAYWSTCVDGVGG